MSLTKCILWPVGAGLMGTVFLSGIYFGLVSWAGSPQNALDLFWKERWIVIPLILGFGIQVALYTILKKHLFVPIQNTGASGAVTGVSGATSTMAMVACCAHHFADVLPIIGLTAAGKRRKYDHSIDQRGRRRKGFYLGALNENLAEITQEKYSGQPNEAVHPPR